MSVQKYFAQISSHEVVQEFIRPASPNQQAHVEAYHSITESVIAQKYYFENIDDLINTMERFKTFYNFNRIHSGLGFISPYKYLLQQGIDMYNQDLEKSIYNSKQV